MDVRVHIPEIGEDFDQHAGASVSEKPIHTALCKFFDSINFQTEDQALQPENIQRTKAAFEQLMQDMDWKLVCLSFKKLQEEKSGPKEFRDDGVTPNWYHEFREMLPFLDMILSGVLSEEILNKDGGIEVLLASLLRHDSWEDFGHSPYDIHRDFEAELHRLNAEGSIDDEQLFVERHRAAGVAQIIDLMTRKIPVYDPETGQIKVDEKTGKKVREARYGGDLNTYYSKLSQKIFAALNKYADTIEGLSTRIMPQMFSQAGAGKFSADDNQRYVDEKRRHYGRAPTDNMLIRKYPSFAAVIHTLDDMAGINVVLLETVNDYFADDSKLNPRMATPIRIKQYVDTVRNNLNYTPAAFRPETIMIGRLEKIARAGIEQKDFRMAEVLEYAIYPAMVPLMDDRRGTLLQKSDYWAYNPADKPESGL